MKHLLLFTTLNTIGVQVQGQVQNRSGKNESENHEMSSIYIRRSAGFFHKNYFEPRKGRVTDTNTGLFEGVEESFLDKGIQELSENFG